jgi:prevent-host-death family protein
MNTIGAYEAKTHLPKLLERVANGETITITRHGVPVAVLAPPPQPRKMTPQEAAEGLRKLRERLRSRGISFTQEEIKEMIHEGHKY